MASTWVDVADSLIKIGLGATIGGGVSIFTQYLSFGKEVLIDRRGRRLRMIEEACKMFVAYQTEEVNLMRTLAIHTSTVHLKGSLTESEERDLDKKLDPRSTDGVSLFTDLTTTLWMIGKSDTAEKVGQLAELAFVARNKIIDARSVSEVETHFDAFRTSATKLKTEIMSDLAAAHVSEPELARFRSTDWKQS